MKLGACLAQFNADHHVHSYAFASHLSSHVSIFSCIVLPYLQSQASRPQGASELQMVAAVSQATRAAAEAATAAAGAAAICIIDPRNGTYTPVRTTKKPSRRRQTKTAPSSSAEDGDQPMPSPT